MRFVTNCRVVPAMLAVMPLLALAAGAEQTGKSSDTPPADLQQRVDHGRDLYVHNCFVCHQSNGQGVPGVFPPLAKSDLIATNLERAIKALAEGMSGEIEVLGKKFN